MIRATIVLALAALAAANGLEPLPRLLDNRIVGGSVAGENEFPYQVSLQKDSVLGRYHFCGASVLDASSVLTAAHCLDGQTAGSITAVAGEWDFGSTSGNEQERAASRLVINSAYNSNTYENDVGIVHLSSSFTLNTYVQRTSLPSSGAETSAGTNAIVTGWGTTTEGGSSPDILRKVTVPVVGDVACNADYGGDVVDTMICAGESGKDSCQGDSGGPLYAGGDQIGIVSWGYGCARPNYPGVYTQVSKFISWINNNKL